MTSSTFSFLNGRTPVETTAAPRRLPRGRRGTAEAMRRWVAARRFASAQREHSRADTTDAYLDRSGLSAADWLEGLTRHAQR